MSRRLGYLNVLTPRGTTRASSWGARLEKTAARILIADDDPRVRDAVKALFERVGLDITEARSGLEALEAARENPPQLVLLEVHLPGVSGYEVCHELKETYGPHLPVIFLS